MSDAQVKLLAVGDMMLRTRDGRPPFEHVGDILHAGDILFGNVETVLSDRGQAVKKAIHLETSPNSVRHLQEAGFDVVSVANNHVLDRGPEAFRDTLAALHGAGLVVIGAGDRVYPRSWGIVRRNRLRLGFLGYYLFGTRLGDNGIFINTICIPSILEDMEQLQRQCDCIVVSLHWGTEGAFFPSPDQIRQARAIIDAGAIVILGHHPHVLQAVERYKHGLIAYSLGNFQFFCSSAGMTNRTIVLQVTIGQHGVRDWSVVPVTIDDNFVPHAADGAAAAEIRDMLDKISLPVVNDRYTTADWFAEIASEYLSGNFKSWWVCVRRYGFVYMLRTWHWLIRKFALRCYLGLGRKWRRGRGI